VLVLWLHFEHWVQRWRRRSAQGDMIVVRYADDVVVGFQYLADAHRFLAELKQRLEAFALELHPDKTRTIEFGRFAHENRRARGQGKSETFAFLGFTHIFGRTREGRRLIRRHTVRERLNAKLRQVKATLRRMRICRSRSRGAICGWCFPASPLVCYPGRESAHSRE
jgi:RNA-directed DNA polymerase